MSQLDFGLNTNQFCSVTDDMKASSSSMICCCHVLNVDLWAVWGFIGLKKTKMLLFLTLSGVIFRAFQVFLDCVHSEFVVSGREDGCKGEDDSCVPVDIEGLFSRMYMLVSSAELLRLSLKTLLPVLQRDMSSLFRWASFGALKTADSRKTPVFPVTCPQQRCVHSNNHSGFCVLFPPQSSAVAVPKPLLPAAKAGPQQRVPWSGAGLLICRTETAS